MREKAFLFVVVVLALITGCADKRAAQLSPVRVELVATGAGHQLLRDGQPYDIRGAGMVVDDLENFAAHGGNSIRTWTTNDPSQDTRQLLDAAYENGVTVALCVSLTAERHGFDYSDPAAVAEQLAALREEILKYRDHPALLFWIIGNELNHSYTDPAVYDAVDGVARMINELDPNHPTTTTVSEFSADLVETIKSRAPSLDFISFQLYGSLFGLPEAAAQAGFEDPFMVTEWGPIGYWEMETTAWGAPVEMTSSEKAETFLRAHQEALTEFDGQLIGSYAFLWGQKQERTPTWFGMLTDSGEETEAVDAMHYLWRGEWPANRSPHVNSLRLDGRTSRQSVALSPGSLYEAVFAVDDPEGDPLTYRWEVKRESSATQVGGDFEPALPNLEGWLSGASAATVQLVAQGPGAYRLFASADDGNGHVAQANIPFSVEGFAQARGDLLAGQVMAVAYSGYREGQHPDRGNGAVNPSAAEVLQDLEILVANDIGLIRMYDSGDHTRTALELIREHELPLNVLLGIWLRAEFSNHLGCPWLDEPIADAELAANRQWNGAEVGRGVQLAQEFAEIVVAVNVGNEALVEWTDHMVPEESVITYVRQVRQSIEQPVTVAENYDWWARHGERLVQELDFVGVHSYPIWEDQSIDEALSYTIQNIEGILPASRDKPLAILEAGWASIASEFGSRANEPDQARYYRELKDWATAVNTTVFFFEAFDEPWKGDELNPQGAEKHWGLFNVDRTPKLVVR